MFSKVVLMRICFCLPHQPSVELCLYLEFLPSWRKEKLWSCIKIVWNNNFLVCKREQSPPIYSIYMAEEGVSEVMRRQGLLCSNKSRWLFGFKRNPSLYGVGTFPKINMEADLKLVTDILYKKELHLVTGSLTVCPTLTPKTCPILQTWF